MIDPKKIHQAMQDAPHDGEPYRQARAAIHAVLLELLEIDPECSPVRAALTVEALT